jgi:hypothetical protein
MSMVAFGARRLCFLLLLALVMAPGERQEASAFREDEIWEGYISREKWRTS